MTENIGMRLQCGETYIVVIPTTETHFDVTVTDFIGRPVGGEERREALKMLLRAVSDLRQQVFEMLDKRL